MEFKYSPYAIFKGSRTPYGLCARVNWMAESTANLRGSIEHLVATICRAQKDNGSWEDSVVRTVENLRILSLLAPDRLDVGAKAVDWLLEKEHPPTVHVSGDGSPYTGLFFRMGHGDVKQIYARRDFLFNPGCSGFVKTGAALFFSGIFGRENDQRVLNAFKSLDKVLEIRGGRFCSLACSNNILRAYASHPRKQSSSQTRKALTYLEKVQTEGGDWKANPYFYRLFNIMAGSNLATARKQVRRAMPRILRSQNRDGGWGRTNREFKTFMVLDGLHQQGLA